MFDVGAGNVAGAPARVHAPIPAQRTGRAVLNGLDRDRRRALGLHGFDAGVGCAMSRCEEDLGR